MYLLDRKVYTQYVTNIGVNDDCRFGEGTLHFWSRLLNKGFGPSVSTLATRDSRAHTTLHLHTSQTSTFSHEMYQML